MKAALALVAWVLSMSKEDAQAEFAITWTELKDEGWNLGNISVISLTAEVLNRYANETQRLNLAPDAYKKALEDHPIEALAQMSVASQSIHDLGAAMTGATKSVKDMGRALKGVNISDNPEDFI